MSSTHGNYPVRKPTDNLPEGVLLPSADRAWYGVVAEVCRYPPMELSDARGAARLKKDVGIDVARHVPGDPKAFTAGSATMLCPCASGASPAPPRRGSAGRQGVGAG